jgi:hypothetical protein
MREDRDDFKPTTVSPDNAFVEAKHDYKNNGENVCKAMVINKSAQVLRAGITTTHATHIWEVLSFSIG